MNKIFGLAIAVLLLVSCGEETPTKRNTSRPSLDKKKALIKIDFDKKGSIAYGDSISVTVSANNADLAVRSLKVSQPDTKFEHQFDGGIANLHSTDLGGGNIRLKFEAEFEDGTKSARYKEFLVLDTKAPDSYELRVVRKYPHDPSSFTQGLLIYKNELYEGTGNYGETRIRRMDLATGEVYQEKELESDIFGEGITIFNDKIYQLTYKSSRGFIYNRETFEREQEFLYQTHTSEGWGLSNNDSELIASDGSAYIFFLDPTDFSEIRRIKVFDNRGEVDNLNELEYYQGALYANIYTTAKIVKIDPESGRVLDEYLARGIVTEGAVTSNMDVLNGITFNPGTGNMLITGKYWSKIYEVEPKPAQ